MTEKIWVSRAMMDEALIKPLVADIAETDVDRAIDAARRNAKGEALPEDRFPDRLYGNDDAGLLESMPDIFFGNLTWCISENSAEVFRNFDLGDGSLYPVKIFQNDRSTPLNGSHYWLNFGTVKRAFLPEKSPKARAHMGLKKVWKPPFVLKNNDIAVSSDALNGPDIWIDTQLYRTFFISDKLACALKAARADRAFGLRRCKLIEKT